ncbi:MAG: hypothetical protein IPM80_19460 [Proteobacteria bacterium]|nr:hypothetical protein [Pseudomonadota bacterium]
MGNTHSESTGLTTTVPRLLLLLVLVLGTGIVRATPLHYSFDLGAAGSGDFTIRADASAPLVDQTELASFNWLVNGVGAFDLADLSTFSFSNWSPLLGASINSSGWVSLGFALKTSTLSDTGVACVLCFSTAQVAAPGTTVQGALARTRIRASASPCGTNLCTSQTPSLALVAEALAIGPAAVPEPSAMSLLALALLMPAATRRARGARAAG